MEVSLDELTHVPTYARTHTHAHAHTHTHTHTHSAHADAAHFQTLEAETVPLFFTVFSVTILKDVFYM